MPQNFFRPEGLVGLWYPGRGTPDQRRGTVSDESGSGNHGTIYGSPCLSFDGTNDQAAVAAPWDSLGGHRYAWLAATVNLTHNAAANQYIRFENYATGDSGTGRNSYIFTSSDKIRFILRAGSVADTARTASSTSAISDLGIWHSFLGYVDLGTNGTIVGGLAAYLWDNGVVVPMDAFSDDANAPDGLFAASVPQHQIFGLDPNFGGDFTGKMQWLGFSGMDAPPTITDAQRYADNPAAWLAQSGLDCYYHCKTDTGTSVPDDSENGHTLTMMGTTWNSEIAAANGGDARNAAGTANSVDSFTGGYRFFDGADDCVGIPDSASLRLGTTPYQIYVWCAIAADAADDSAIIGKGFGELGKWYVYLGSGVNAGKMAFYADNGAIFIIGGSSIKDGALHLLSVLRNGNDVEVFVDTVSIGTDSGVHDLDTTIDMQLMAANSINPCKGNLYCAMVGKANITIAEAVNQMKSIFAQGLYK